MKRPLLPIIAALLGLTALVNGSTAAKNAEAPKKAAPLSEEQETKVMTLAKTFLSQAIQIRKDGSASSIHARMDFRAQIEWRNLVFRQLIYGSVSAKDRSSGIQRRMYAQLHSDSYRISTDKDLGWSDWSSDQCPVLPAYLLIEEVDGQFMLSAPGLAHFTPGSTDPAELSAQPSHSELILASN